MEFPSYAFTMVFLWGCLIFVIGIAAGYLISPKTINRYTTQYITKEREIKNPPTKQLAWLVEQGLPLLDDDGKYIVSMESLDKEIQQLLRSVYYIESYAYMCATRTLNTIKDSQK